jgi:hypothetical protein
VDDGSAGEEIVMSLTRDEISKIRSRLERLREGIPSLSLENIRDVVVVASSSRGGSSMFMEMLRHSPGMLHLQAEINPFLVLAERTWPHSGADSDYLDESHLNAHARAVIEEELGRELGSRQLGEIDRVRLARDLCWRLTVQWPRIHFELSAVQTWVNEVLNAQSVSHAEELDLESLHLGLIHRLRRLYPEVNPWFYDIDPRRVRAAFPDLAEPDGPPGDVLLEEPPFILAGPWTSPAARDVSRLPLVIKTPSNAYRLEFLAALFPCARLRVLHLTRNPAASINGLLDGWRFRGFHAHRMPEPLAVEGYVDQRPEDARWWKYDLAPGWQALTERPLAEICAHQWASAHEAILAHIEKTDCDHHRLHFEDLVGDDDLRRATFARLFDWLGVELDGRMVRVIEEGIPPVMATSRPRHRRWYERAGLLEPLIAEPRIEALARRLGYGETATWT